MACARDGGVKLGRGERKAPFAGEGERRVVKRGGIGRGEEAGVESLVGQHRRQEARPAGTGSDFGRDHEEESGRRAQRCSGNLKPM